jgi:hypothetical protein
LTRRYADATLAVTAAITANRPSRTTAWRRDFG